MASLSGIRLCPLGEGESVEIPSTKTTVGRGSFLQVSDKRVSRNHATLEINDAGKLVIVPIHTNPCFFKMHGNGQQIILAKDKPRVLEHGDVLSLLPDKFFFQVAYSNEDGLDNSKKVTIKNDGDVDDSCEDKSIMIAGADSDGKEMALPLGNRRVLPTWMKGAAKRVSPNQAEPKSSVQGPKTESNSVSASKTPSRPKTQQPISKARTPRKSKKSESEELDLDEEEEERPSARKGSRKRKNASRRGRYRGDDYEEDDEEEEEKVLPVRRPRAASLKKPKYTDDDFVISDEELDLENMLSESERDGGGRKGKDEDSDFVLDEEDSGSDWESHSRKTKAKHGKFGRSSSVKGRGSQRAKRKRVQNSDSFSDENSDGYVPRLSKRRAAAAATTRMKASKISDDEDDDDDDDDDDDYSDNSEVETRKPKHKKAKRPSDNPQKRKSKRRASDVDDEEDDDADKLGSNDEEMDVDDEGTEKKKQSQDDKACNRKDPKLSEDLSQPQNDSGKGDDSESDERKGTANIRQKRAAAVRQQEKLKALHNESGEEEEEEEEEEEGEEEKEEEGVDGDDDFQEDENMKKNSVVDEDSVNGNGDGSRRGSDSDFDPEDVESEGRSSKVKHLMPNKLKQKTAAV